MASPAVMAITKSSIPELAVFISQPLQDHHPALSEAAQQPVNETFNARFNKALARRKLTHARLISRSSRVGRIELYLAAVDDLATTPSHRLVEGDEEVASALRELISAVVVHPAGKDEPSSR
jgi:hypothetical protein